MNIEEVRVELCQNQEFSPQALFNSMKLEKKDCANITHEHVKEFLYRDDELTNECLDTVVHDFI